MRTSEDRTQAATGRLGFFTVMHFKLSGLIPIGGGIYELLLVYRVFPRKPKDPEKLELWHRKFDKMMKIVSPLLIGFGFLQSLGVL